MALGRGLDDVDEREANRNVVISHGLWRSHFGGAASVVGSTISLRGEPFTVVGVAKPDPAIFLHVGDAFASIDNSRIVYVGDSVTIDVAGATAAGLQPVLLDPYDDHVDAPFARIHDVAGLLALPKRC